MVGLGEETAELLEVFRDLAGVGCDILTIGQYLRPSRDHLPMARLYTPREFAELKSAALKMGFRHVESGPLVRSSYHAHEQAAATGMTVVAWSRTTSQPLTGCRIAVGSLAVRRKKAMAPSFMAGIPALKDLNPDLRRRMDQAVATFQASLASTRTGRASVHMLDQVKVDYYGTPTPISQMAQVSAPEAQLILISPWDPTILKDMEKAIQSADLGLNPISDGKVHPHSSSAHDRGPPPRCLQAHQQGS